MEITAAAQEKNYTSIGESLADRVKKDARGEGRHDCKPRRGDLLQPPDRLPAI